MAIMRKKDIRKLEGKELEKKLNEMRLELAKQRASVKIGATVTSPGRIRELRKTVARGLTIKKEKEIKTKEFEGAKRLQSKE
jgi:large subunit ribosomal protein L29